MTTEEQAQANDQERRRLVAMRDSFPRNTMNEQWLMFDAEVRKVGPIVADEPDAPTNPEGPTVTHNPTTTTERSIGAAHTDSIDQRDEDVHTIRWALDAMHFGEAQGWTMSEQQHAKTVALLSALRQYDSTLFTA